MGSMASEAVVGDFMTNEEAKRILHPSTSAEALAEIEYYGGFNGAKAKEEAFVDAYQVAIDAIEKQIPKKPWHRREEDAEGWACPACHMGVTVDHGRIKDTFCSHCGQALDWEET